MEYIKESLINLRNIINGMSYSPQKIRYISDFMNLYDLGIKLEIIDSSFEYPRLSALDIKRYNNMMHKTDTIIRDEIITNNDNLLLIEQELLDYAKTLSYFYYNDEINCNSKKIYKNIYDFLEFIGSDALNILNSINDNVNLYVFDDYEGVDGYTYELINIISPIMLANRKKKDLSFYTTLVHELGHIYQSRLSSKWLKTNTLTPYSECSSILFELLFIEYLETNNCLDKTTIGRMRNNTLFQYIEFIKEAYVGSVILKNDENSFIRLEDYAIQTSYSDYEINELYNSVDSKLFECITKNDLEIYPLIYFTGFLKSSNLYADFINNKTIGKRNFDDFILLSSHTKLNDVLEDISLEPVKKLLKDGLKSYY